MRAKTVSLAFVLFVAAMLTARPAAASPELSNLFCAEQIHRAYDAGDPTLVAPRCWHIGPIALGMSRSEVETLLGPPDFLSRGSVAFFVFPRDLSARMQQHPSMNFPHRILEVAYSGDQVAAIGINPSETLWSQPCQSAIDMANGEAPADFARFEAFSGVVVGEDMSAAQRTLGDGAHSSAGDFYNYWPLLLTFDLDERGKIYGFAISSSKDIEARSMAFIKLSKDPATCKNNGFTLLAKGPSQ